MHRRPYVLHICNGDHRPSLVEAVLARAGFGVLPARTFNEALRQVLRADAAVICSCWDTERKHRLIQALRAGPTVPVVCINENSHACCACTEADRFHPDDLVAGIRRKLSIPATSNAAAIAGGPPTWGGAW